MAPSVGVEPAGSLADNSMDEQCAKYAQEGPGFFFEKGNMSNVFTFAVMLAGIAMRFSMDSPWDENAAGRYILAFGLFGFAGGVTNYLAIYMLFEEVPGLYGSGIIPKRFQQIKATLKTMIMDTFFEPAFLEKQLKQTFGDPNSITEKLTALMESDGFDQMLTAKLESLTGNSGPLGMMLSMMNLNADKLKPFLRPFVAGVAKDIGPMLAAYMDGGSLPVLKIRDEVEKLMDERLKELTADRVKKLIEVVMKTHLGWLVVWGNIFGGLIGIAAEAVGY